MKERSVLYKIMTFIGLALLLGGLYMIKKNIFSDGVAPYLLLGFGCGVFVFAADSLEKSFFKKPNILSPFSCGLLFY